MSGGLRASLLADEPPQIAADDQSRPRPPSGAPTAEQSFSPIPNVGAEKLANSLPSNLVLPDSITPSITDSPSSPRRIDDEDKSPTADYIKIEQPHITRFTSLDSAPQLNQVENSESAYKVDRSLSEITEDQKGGLSKMLKAKRPLKSILKRGGSSAPGSRRSSLSGKSERLSFADELGKSLVEVKIVEKITHKRGVEPEDDCTFCCCCCFDNKPKYPTKKDDSCCTVS
jgi:hypothetical protein